MRITIDAGHGPDTPGKRSPDGSLREFAFNSVVAKYVAELLNQYENVQTLFAHDNVRDVPLSERTNRANSWGADLFVSIHANAASDSWSAAQGIETYVYETRPAAAVALALAVQRQLIKLTGRVDRGVKSANFQVLRETRCTAILVECGFMTHKTEVEMLKSDEYRRKCAQAIVAGIVETYGLKRKAGAVVESEKNNIVTVIVNGKKVQDGLLIDGSTYVPVRAVAEALGAGVSWDGKTKTVTIKGAK